MKIAEVVATFPPYPGGTGYVCWHNASELARRGHHVSVFTLDFGKLKQEDRDSNNFQVIRLKPRPLLGGGGIVPQLYPELKKFDVVHLHYPFFGGAEYVYLSSLFRGQNYLTTFHQNFKSDSILKNAVIGLYDMLFMSKIMRKSSRVGILSSEHFESSKAAAYVDRGKIVELPNGVDVDIFSPREKDKTLVDRYGLQGKNVILFVGHLMPFKGLHILLEALSMMHTENMALVVVGTGYLEPEYKKFAAQKGLSDHVIFAGYKHQMEELPRYYNTCDFLVLPSIGAPESFGMVTLEAMASGRPAIVTSLPGPSSLVENEVDGLIAVAGDPVDLKQKMEHLIFNSDKREQMGASARQKVVERYSWNHIGHRLENILQEITLQ